MNPTDPIDPAGVIAATDRLQRLLGGPALADLRQRLRRVFEQAPPGEEPATLRLNRLAPHEAEALQALTGRAPRASSSMQINLRTLGAQLRAAGLANHLPQALELIDGPLSTHLAERAAASLAWATLVRQPAPHATLATLLSTGPGLGLLKRLAQGDAATANTLCRSAARVLHTLPAAGMPRARLAALQLGHAHALDDGQAVATLVLACLRQASKSPPENTAIDETPSRDSTRVLWASQGVAVNELARPVLWLNLPGTGLLSDGEPRYSALRQLLRSPPAWQVAGRTVFVCENPNLVALAADTLGANCSPLVCTDGMPAAAQRALLQQLARAGARLCYHGDFDWPGITIANLVLQDFDARAWRMSTADYRAALELAADGPQARLRGKPVLPCWDPTLGWAMGQAGVAVAEEAVFDLLRPDLAA